MPQKVLLPIPDMETNQAYPRERDLLWGILERAFWDVLNEEKKSYADCSLAERGKKNENRSAKSWVFDCSLEYEDALPFSFPWICAHLDQEPEDMQKVLKKLLSSNEKPKRVAYRSRRKIFRPALEGEI